MQRVSWPYPRWIAHRGAGKLAPENTLAAFRIGASHGYRMFECDVKLSSDGIPFLLHDDTLLRTTNASERLAASCSSVAGSYPWGTLAQLDAGSWHSRTFAGEPLPTLEAIARYCLRNAYFLNIEIKPTPGLEHQTGEVIANHAADLWRGANAAPLLTSFEVPALEAAMAAQPDLPRGLLLNTLWPGWLETAQGLNCVAIICNHVLWNPGTMALAQQADFKTLSYTVNDEATARRLLDLGLDGIITDRIDLFKPVTVCP
jgi:glycerophosphoryl diester phosphodiesterase